MRLLAVLVLALSRPLLASPPVLVVEAPPELAAEARRVREIEPIAFRAALDLSGLGEAGAPIRVVLAPEGSALARGTPSFISGFASGDEIVLFPRRAPHYPSGGIEEVLKHEMAHVFLSRAARGRPLPRWFHEGIAMTAARPFGMEDRARVFLELFRAPPTLKEIEAMFAGDERSVTRAYALSGAFVDDLLRQYGGSFPGAVVKRVAAGDPFAFAFSEIAGAPLAVEEWRFARRHTSLEGWTVLLTSSATLWAGITILALLAIAVRRRRNAKERKRLEDLEASAPPAAAPGQEEPEDAGPDLTIN